MTLDTGRGGDRLRAPSRPLKRARAPSGRLNVARTVGLCGEVGGPGHAGTTSSPDSVDSRIVRAQASTLVAVAVTAATSPPLHAVR